MKISISIEANDKNDLREAIRALAPLGSDPGKAAKAFADALLGAQGSDKLSAAATAAEEAAQEGGKGGGVPGGTIVFSGANADPEPKAKAPLLESAPPEPTPKRERGKPDPASGRTRRTKAEIEEDERAEQAEARPAPDPDDVLGGPDDDRFYFNEGTDALEVVRPGEEPPAGKFWTQVTGREYDGHKARLAAHKGGVASKFEEEIQEAAAPEPMPRVEDEDTYWFDAKREEYFMVAAGDDLPPDTDRYEEVTRRVYDRAMKDAKPEPAKTPTEAPKAAVKLSLDDVLAKMDELMNAVPTDRKGDAAMNANAVYKSFGAARIKDLKPEHFAASIAKLEDLIAEAKATRKGRG